MDPSKVGPRVCRVVVLVPSQGEIKAILVGSELSWIEAVSCHVVVPVPSQGEIKPILVGYELSWTDGLLGRSPRSVTGERQSDLGVVPTYPGVIQLLIKGNDSFPSCPLRVAMTSNTH